MQYEKHSKKLCNFKFYTIVVKVLFHIFKTNWAEILLQDKGDKEEEEELTSP